EFLDEFEEDIEKTGALDTIMGSSRLKAAYQTVKKSLDRLYDDMVRFGAEVENLQAKTGAMTSDVMQRYQRGKRAMQSALLNYRSKRARSRGD
ncbi:MAG: hypothetical protein NZM05_12625, partial [Chloroherpetonaceae bacterium]|nr:hypothetical protein [Chloroherpetonaceae bacterium]